MKNLPPEIIKKTENLKTSERICARVAFRIERARTVRNRIYASLHGLLILAAGIAFVPALTSLIRGATQSGFLQYASLTLSDGSYAIANWRELVWSMAESMPILASAAVLAILIVFINSVHYGIRYLRPRAKGAGVRAFA